MTSSATLRAATRQSALARRQTELVAQILAADRGVEIAPVPVSTEGDRAKDAPIHQMGGKGVFVKEVQEAVLDGRADIAVHSAKDLPSQCPTGLILAAILPRGDPRDALIGGRLAELRAGAVIATGSARRKAQLAHLRPDLNFRELRGNIATRLDKARHHDAILMAAVALHRLDIEPEVVDILEPDVLVPQVGQGAIAVECRLDDLAVRELLAAVEHAPSRRVVDAERAFLAELGGDCSLPAAAHATLVDDSANHLKLTGLLASLAGDVVIRESRIGAEPDVLGRAVARHLIDERGGQALLSATQ